MKLALVSADVVPNIVKSWRAAKIDWHSLVPKHPGQWERFGTPQGEGKLRLLVSKETLITDYLTRFQESGLAGMYGHDHGALSSYSGCNVFASSCAIHDKSICDKDELCVWSADRQLCVDFWDGDSSNKAAGLDQEKQSCPRPMVVGDRGFQAVRDVHQCEVYVHQPAVMVSLDSEAQSMFYHWWAAWTGLVGYWKTSLNSRRDAHFFLDAINDPMFFHFFGLLSDNCWRRIGVKYNPPSVCYCDTSHFNAGQTRDNAKLAANHMLEYLGLQDERPPPSRVKIGLISRRRKRFILNEYELVQRVEKLGYDCVLLPLETMTMHEQMQQLRTLDVLVGIHGSALDNAVFLQPGSVLVQLLPYKVEHRVTFRATAEAAGVRYMEWQLKDPELAVFHWDLLDQANAEILKRESREQYLAKGQRAADNRETLMFWINQDIVVPGIEWDNLIRSAVAESPAGRVRGLH